MRLEFLYDGEVVRVHELGNGPVRIGRAPVNDVVLRDADVSGHHAVVWAEGAELWFEDLGSTNGSWSGEERIVARRLLAVGEVVRLGRNARVRVGAGSAVPRGPLVLESEDGRYCLGVSGARVALPAGPTDAALLLDEDGAAWLAVPGAPRVPVTIDVPFRVGEERFVLRHARGPVADTLRDEEPEPDCVVRVRLADSVAFVTAPSGASCTVRTEPRVALLYTLGRRWREDGPGPGRGWMDDDEVASGVWGRAARGRQGNALNVLVHRLRAALDRAGMDRRTLEKRQGGIRLRAASVELE